MTEPQDTPESTRQKKRGAFPRIPLKSVLELVDGIFELGHGDPVRRRTAFEQIGRSPDSSASYTLISAANGGYGLVTGGKNATHLGLTTDGQKLARTKGEDRKKAAIDVLFANDYFAALVDKFSDRPFPLDSIAVDFLQRDHSLEDTDAESCWSVAKDNIFDYGLYEESGNKQVILPRGHAYEAVGATEPAEPPDSSVIKPSTVAPVLNPKKEAPQSGRRPTQIAFNIQVVLPDNASAETYDAIFRSIAKNLLDEPSE
jgi:hypothetical protein